MKVKPPSLSVALGVVFGPLLSAVLMLIHIKSDRNLPIVWLFLLRLSTFRLPASSGLRNRLAGYLTQSLCRSRGHVELFPNQECQECPGSS